MNIWIVSLTHLENLSVIIGGDFNVHIEDRLSADTIRFESIVNKYGLKQHF